LITIIILLHQIYFQKFRLNYFNWNSYPLVIPSARAEIAVLVIKRLLITIEILLDNLSNYKQIYYNLGNYFLDNSLEKVASH